MLLIFKSHPLRSDFLATMNFTTTVWLKTHSNSQRNQLVTTPSKSQNLKGRTFFPRDVFQVVFFGCCSLITWGPNVIGCCPKLDLKTVRKWIAWRSKASWWPDAPSCKRSVNVDFGPLVTGFWDRTESCCWFFQTSKSLKCQIWKIFFYLFFNFTFLVKFTVFFSPVWCKRTWRTCPTSSPVSRNSRRKAALR